MNKLVNANVSSHICLLQLLRERSRHQCCDVGTAGPRKLLGEVVFLQITYRCSQHIKVNMYWLPSKSGQIKSESYHQQSVPGREARRVSR